jgi:hypothetical protein
VWGAQRWGGWRAGLALLSRLAGPSDGPIDPSTRVMNSIYVYVYVYVYVYTHTHLYSSGWQC